MELPVSSRARTLTPFMIICLQGRDSGLGEVKQQERTVQKLIIDIGRETDQMFVSLLSFPFPLLLIHILQRIPLLAPPLLELHTEGGAGFLGVVWRVVW